MINEKIKVKTLKLKGEKIKYTIVSCTQEVVSKIPVESWDNILELTKNVVKKGKRVGYFNKFRLAQGYNFYVKNFNKKQKKIGTFLLGFCCFPKLALIGFGLQKGAVSQENKLRYVKVALPAE